jgi:hypothetical protein
VVNADKLNRKGAKNIFNAFKKASAVSASFAVKIFLSAAKATLSASFAVKIFLSVAKADSLSPPFAVKSFLSVTKATPSPRPLRLNFS